MTTQNKILVVGGSGFIGRHLVLRCIEEGLNVTVLCRKGLNVEPRGYSQITVDISNLSALQRSLKNLSFDYVVNLGGCVDHSSFDSVGLTVIAAHFTGVQNLVHCLSRKQLKAFIQIGSSDEYGNQSAPQSENNREQSFSPYSFAKTAATHFLQMLYRAEQYPAVILRLFLVYGPEQNKQRFLPQIISGCLQDKQFPASLGEQLRDFCYISDVVNGIICALNKPEILGEVINLASGRAVKIRELIEQVRKRVGAGNPDYGKFPYRQNENMALYADIEKANTLLGWNSEISLEEGLDKTIKHYNSMFNEKL